MTGAFVRVRSLTLSPEGDLLVAFTGEYDPPTIFSAAVIAAVDPATSAGASSMAARRWTWRPATSPSGAH